MRDWPWYKNVWWILREKVRRLYWRLTTRKCEAPGCQRRLERPYRWCSLECYVYCGGSLKRRDPNETDTK